MVRISISLNNNTTHSSFYKQCLTIHISQNYWVRLINWCSSSYQARLSCLQPSFPACHFPLQLFNIYQSCSPCRLRGCKNWPAPFHGRMSYNATKPALVSVLYLSMHYTVLLFIRAPFYVLLVFIAMCAVFWLFWLSYHYLPSDWLERLVCIPILLCFLGHLSHLPYSFWR